MASLKGGRSSINEVVVEPLIYVNNMVEAQALNGYPLIEMHPSPMALDGF
jgi:hypothetical protein